MNPWLNVPLEDYEAHMSLPSVAQSRILADSIGALTESLRPESVAIVGCSGGNGFDRISVALVHRVVGIDINPQYIAETRKRFHDRFNQLELYCQDFIDEDCSFRPVDLVIAHLVFEYMDFRAGLSSIMRFLNSGGYLSAILQLRSEKISAISPSPFVSLKKLGSIMNFVPPDEFEQCAETLGFKVRRTSRLRLPSGKEFHELLFQAARK